MENVTQKILLLISDQDDLEKNLSDLSHKFAPNKTFVLCSNGTLTLDSAECRPLIEDTKEDCILKTIRELSDIYDSELICCSAGSSELCIIVTNAMSLAAGYKDRLCHVRSNPFSITDIPFTRLCYLYQDKFNCLPETFADNMELANLRISRNIDAPDLYLSADPINCMIGESELPLEAEEFILFWLLATRCKNEITPLQGEVELLDEYQAFIASTLVVVMPEIGEIREKLLQATTTDMLNLVDALTLKIKQNVAFEDGRDFSLVVRDKGIYGISFPPENVTCPRNY